MRYDEFRIHVDMIGSGTIESEGKKMIAQWPEAQWQVKSAKLLAKAGIDWRSRL